MNGLVALAVALAAFTGIGAGIGISLATGKVAESIARQPEAASKITNSTLIGMAFAEATAIYGFVIALLMLFSK